jgi:hypothetical protein|tara:strand:+ start:2697 stop:2840 length:144 start_codon:yes stop_codon:yes gene_type:complete
MQLVARGKIALIISVFKFLQISLGRAKWADYAAEAETLVEKTYLIAV